MSEPKGLALGRSASCSQDEGRALPKFTDGPTAPVLEAARLLRDAADLAQGEAFADALRLAGLAMAHLRRACGRRAMTPSPLADESCFGAGTIYPGEEPDELLSLDANPHPKDEMEPLP